jgi:hypothetical protein
MIHATAAEISSNIAADPELRNFIDAVDIDANLVRTLLDELPAHKAAMTA